MDRRATWALRLCALPHRRPRAGRARWRMSRIRPHARDPLPDATPTDPPLRDERAVERRVQEDLERFLSRRVDGEMFVHRLLALWRRAMAPGQPPPTPFLRVVRAIGPLCQTYLEALPPGAGYRVSDEQLRHEIRSRVGPLVACHADADGSEDCRVVPAMPPEVTPSS